MRGSLLALFCILLMPQEARCAAQDDPRAIIEKAIAAQGGEAAVAKIKVMRRVIKGSLVVDPRLPAVPMTYVDVWQLPRQLKSVIEMVVHGVNTTRVMIVNGDQGWDSYNGRTQRLTGEAYADLLEGRYAESLEWLLLLRDKALDLSLAKEAMIEGRPAVGVTVNAKGHKEVTLYFDRETMLLAKRASHVKYLDGRLMFQETFFSDHKDFDGVKLWTKSYACHDGKKFVEGEVSDVVFPEKIEDSEFGQPAHGPEKAWPMNQRSAWLWNLAQEADRSRKYDLAEAYMNGVLAFYPEDGYVLGTLACYVGKQGRYQEALDLTALAEKAERHNAVQVAGIKATWLAHLGRKDEAEKVWKNLPVPAYDARDNYEMYYACRAFYTARIEKSAENLKKAMGALFKDRCTGHWLAFVESDISFDEYRAQEWFKEATTSARALLKN